MNPETGPMSVATSPAASVRTRIARMAGPVGLGTLVVALAAQVVVPIPLNPVPITLQPLAVLTVGGLLGMAGGVSALVLYLILGSLGLPVFAGGGAGVYHLLARRADISSPFQSPPE